MTLRQAVAGVAGNPWNHLFRAWNWKSALFSSLIRGGIFFAVNRRAGFEAATAAMGVEALYAAGAAGFWGSLVQAFRKVEPPWQAAVVLGLLVPGAAHLLEAAVHWLNKTPNLRASVFASMTFSALSMLFNLHMMRQGVMIVGHGRRPLLDDFRRIPFVIATFLITGVRLLPRGAALLREFLLRRAEDKVL